MPIISLPADPTSPSQSLTPFPIQLDTKDGKAGKLLKQIRIRYLNEPNSRHTPITFINTYGFVYARDTSGGIHSELSSDLAAGSITACMMTLGPGPNIQNANLVLRSLNEFYVKVKKTSSQREEAVFELINIPTLMREHALCKRKMLVCSAEKFLKNPSKLQAGFEYVYIPTFVSITYSPRNLNYQVARPILKFRSRFVYSIHLELILRLLCKSESPLMKSYNADKTGRGCLASVWIHVCNILKNKSIKQQGRESYFIAKCMSMQLQVSIADLWGPTIIIKSLGHIPKTALPFFSKDGIACHPLQDVSPTLTKSLWSVGCEIESAKLILQESDLNELMGHQDLITDKIAIRSGQRTFERSKFSPFKKYASIPNLEAIN
uniref:Matrix protein n=1 Tax=Human parainfluenza 2 virus TaxID=2560525 RepID=A0A3G3C0W8_PI2H|nr:matrix protein [Human orthorubulavirus 2]